MHTTRLLKRSLTYYWQTNLVVVLGVAIAVSVLAGALLIGESVRGSLRDLSSRRLGKTDDLISSAGFFREQLAADLEQRGQFVSDPIGVTSPLIALDGVVVHEASKRRAGGVKVYGVDEGSGNLTALAGVDAPQNRDTLVSQSLATELGSGPGDSLLLRLEKPSDIPVESLHGRKEDPGRTIRLNITRALPGESLGEFSLQPQHGAVRAVFVSLSFLQRELEQAGRVNTILVARLPTTQPEQQRQWIGDVLKKKSTLEDLGLNLRTLNDQQSISLESSSKIINDHITTAARESANALSLRTVPVLSYLANSISSGDRSTPYSLVTALDDETLARLSKPTQHSSSQPPIILNEWAARDLNVKPGDIVSLEYYLWLENGRLETKKADFVLSGVVPIAGLAADRDLVPEYPGITESENLSDWDPPFPIDLERVRKEDEDYWHEYKTTPKAFIPLSTAQSLWATRFGNLTSIRIESAQGQLTPEIVNNYRETLRQKLDPALMGIQVVAVRDEGQAASRGATDFGEYFLYFSFFLVVSALMLTTLFFKLGIEQRAREIGTLQAIGFSDAGIRRLFLAEGILLSVIGSLLGLLGAIGYAALLMYGLTDVVGGCSWNDFVDAAHLVALVSNRRDGWSGRCGRLHLLYFEETWSNFDARSSYRIARHGRTASQRHKGAKKRCPGHCLWRDRHIFVTRRLLSTNPPNRRFLRRRRDSARCRRLLFIKLAKTKGTKSHPGHRLVDHRTPRIPKRHLPPGPHSSLHHVDRLRSFHHRRRRFIPAFRRCRQ